MNDQPNAFKCRTCGAVKESKMRWCPVCVCGNIMDRVPCADAFEKIPEEDLGPKRSKK